MTAVYCWAEVLCTAAHHYKTGGNHTFRRLKHPIRGTAGVVPKKSNDWLRPALKGNRSISIKQNVHSSAAKIAAYEGCKVICLGVASDTTRQQAVSQRAFAECPQQRRVPRRLCWLGAWSGIWLYCWAELRRTATYYCCNKLCTAVTSQLEETPAPPGGRLPAPLAHQWSWDRTQLQSNIHNRPGWFIPIDRSYQSGSNLCDTAAGNSIRMD